MNVIGLMRVKNEARWIAESVESLLKVAPQIVVLDDRSDDDTPAILARYKSEGVTTLRSKFTGLDEVRDKNLLLDYARLNFKIHWAVMLDGDEVLTRPDVLLDAMQSSLGRALALPVRYMWDRADQIRVDGVYRNMSRASAFRPGRDQFASSGGVNFHCGNVPQAIRGRELVNAPLLHYGYLDRADRIRKYRWYNEHDPNNAGEDRYRHIVIGDLYDPQSKFMHGGPLELMRV